MQLIRLPEVRDRTGMSRSAIYDDPTFPSPVKIGPRAVAWVEAEIDAWIETKIHERDKGKAGKRGEVA